MAGRRFSHSLDKGGSGSQCLRSAMGTRTSRQHPLPHGTDRSHHFQGLPLTVLALAFTYVLALFAGIVEDVVTSDPIVAIDHATSQLVAAFRVPEIIPPFVWITDLASRRWSGCCWLRWRCCSGF